MYWRQPKAIVVCFFFNDTATAEIYTLSLHDALPICWLRTGDVAAIDRYGFVRLVDRTKDLIKSGGEWIGSVELENEIMAHRSEEHTSELQSRQYLVCRLLLEKKNNTTPMI